jgi:hypothetical protein
MIKGLKEEEKMLLLPDMHSQGMREEEEMLLLPDMHSQGMREEEKMLLLSLYLICTLKELASQREPSVAQCVDRAHVSPWVRQFESNG